MGRISEKHPRYRTKDQIVKDVAFILGLPITYGTKFAVLKEACWAWTEFNGKYKGCPRWTKMAVTQYELDKTAPLIHEHAVPQAHVIRMLCALKPPPPEQVRDIFQKYVNGVVVTKEEDAVLNGEYRSKMPPEFDDPEHPDFRNPWLRYKQCGIECIRPTW